MTGQEKQKRFFCFREYFHANLFITYYRDPLSDSWHKVNHGLRIIQSGGASRDHTNGSKHGADRSGFLSVPGYSGRKNRDESPEDLIHAGEASQTDPLIDSVRAVSHRTEQNRRYARCTGQGRIRPKG